MDSWSAHTPSPSLKFENSPTESLLSTPGEMYPSLFGTDARSPSTLNPVDMMTPNDSYSECGDGDIPHLSMSPCPETPSGESPSSEKKQTKKRKSWGQVLPEPKTNLPPRKRAKTEDEKEQRRVERVLRNRRAAQSSRERKRQEVEGLEKRNKDLENKLRQLQQANEFLVAEMQKMQRNPSAVSRAATSFEALRPNPVTFSQELFSSHDGHEMTDDEASSLEQLLTVQSSNQTVNPAALSPTLTPVPEADEEEQDETATDATPLAGAAPMPKANASPDATQHPAVSVGGSIAFGVDGGVPAAVAPGASSSLAAPDSTQFHLDDAFILRSASDADRYVYESGLLSSPNSSDFEYDHLVGDDALSFQFPTHNDFDISDFITDDANVASYEQHQQHPSHSHAVADSSFFDPETQVSSEDSYLQPHSGASLDGCDDGGLAVSVI